MHAQGRHPIAVGIAAVIVALALGSSSESADAAPPGAPHLRETSFGPDSAQWPSSWMTWADRGTATVRDRKGHLETTTTGPMYGPKVRVRAKDRSFDSIDLTVAVEHVAGTSPLTIRVFADSPAALALVLYPTSWYQLYQGTNIVIDAVSSGRRPPDAGTGHAWNIRFRVERNAGATDIYVKRWAHAGKEPNMWHHAIWQNPDPALRAAKGALELEVSGRGAAWLVDEVKADQIEPTRPLARASKHEGLDASGDLRLPANGRDISLILPQALSRVPSGSTVYLAPKGRYGVEQTMTISGLKDVTIVGQGAVFTRSPEGARGPYFVLSNCENLTISGIEVAGSETDWHYGRASEFDAGFRVQGSRNIALQDVNVHHIGGDAVQGQTAQNVSVRMLRASFVQRQGVSFNDGKGFTLEDSSFEWIGRSIIDVEPYTPTWATADIAIRRNTARHFMNFFFAGGGAGRHDGVTIEDNTITGGFGFILLGATVKNADGTRTPVPATGVSILRNRYDYRDPALVQTRNLDAFVVAASDRVVVRDNDFNFLSENAMRIVAPTASVTHNRFIGVDGGLIIDTGTPSCLSMSDNVIARRSGDRVGPTLQPAPPTPAPCPPTLSGP